MPALAVKDAAPEASPYMLYVYVGAGQLPQIETASIVTLTPRDGSAQAALDALLASGMTAADLRTRTLFVAGEGSTATALVSYAALCGFAGRQIDVSDLRSVTEAASLDKGIQTAELAGEPVDSVLVGPGSSDVYDQFDMEDIARIHHAKRALFVVGDADALTTFESFLTICSLRRRRGGERYPLLCETAPAPESAADGTAVIDLDALRRQAAQLRRDRRIDARDVTVENVGTTVRQQRLAAAAAMSLEDVLVRLGSHLDTERGLWRCPRPERHRNGDANPSSQVTDDGFRCYRCDGEHVDALRLVMDAQGVGPDSAADWLLGA